MTSTISISSIRTRVAPILFLLAACTQVADPGSLTPRVTPTSVTQASTSPTTSPPSTVQKRLELDSDHLSAWGSLALVGAAEFPNYETLDQMVDRASLIFLGGVAGPSVEKVFKDSETDDSFSFYETQIQVETALGGSRFAVGDKTITVITLRRFPDDLIGVPALWILRHAQDNPLGKMDRPEEDDVYWIPSLGIWVDRGDGRPVAPLSEAERIPDGVEMNDWVFDPNNEPLLPFGATEAEVQAMTIDQLVEYIRSRS